MHLRVLTKSRPLKVPKKKYKTYKTILRTKKESARMPNTKKRLADNKEMASVSIHMHMDGSRCFFRDA